MVKKLSGSSQQEKRQNAKRAGITAKLADELKVLAAMSDDEIDVTDIQEKLDWTKAERGKFYHPIKKLISLRVDADVLAWFRAHNRSYTPIMNEALRTYIILQEQAKQDSQKLDKHRKR